MQNRQDAFTLVAYLVAASNMVFEEPQLYASMRLIEAASRASSLAPEGDAFLSAVGEEINSEKWRQIDDHDGYRTWLEGLLRRTAAEAKRRNVEFHGGAEAASASVRVVPPAESVER